MKNLPKLFVLLAVLGTIACQTNSAFADKLENKSIKKIQLNEVSDIDGYVKGHPFLASSILDESKIDNKDYVATKMSVGIFKPKSTSAQFLFVQFTGSLYCSLHGCPLDIYKNNKHIKSITLNKFFVQDCPTKFYLLTAAKKGFNRFSLYPTSKKIEKVTSYNNITNVPNCSE